MSSLLQLAGVGKDYAKVDSRGGRLRLVADLLRGRSAAHVFRALDGVTLDLNRGESLGVIGENGAGKSTMLKIVAGVIKPTRGTVAVHGRIGALLELGSGFHPEYTGRANIELAATLLGLSPDEIAARREEIIAFADIGEHIDDPIKHYSSGMVVRLGFAVATTLSPDILITDEVLAVGDESFQKKCVTWMERYLENGGTLIMCSHSMYHVQKLCRHALWLKDGRVERNGPASDVTQAYLAFHEEKRAATQRPPEGADASAAVGGYYRLRSVAIAPAESVAENAPLTVAGDIESPDGRPPVVLVGIVRADGTPVYGVATDMDRVAPRATTANHYAFELEFPSLPLLPGKYFVRVHVLDPEGVRMFDTIEKPLVVTGSSRELGLVRIAHRWRGAEVAFTRNNIVAVNAGASLDAARGLETSLTIEEVDDAAPVAGELFHRSFGHPIPDFPRHFVALGRNAAGGTDVVGYVHYTAWETSSWLCGGVCADRDAYARADPADAAAWKRAGGIGEILLRNTFARLTDRIAIFSYCGDARQWQHDLNAGFVPAGPPQMLVHWTRPVPAEEQKHLIERVAALPRF